MHFHTVLPMFVQTNDEPKSKGNHKSDYHCRDSFFKSIANIFSALIKPDNKILAATAGSDVGDLSNKLMHRNCCVHNSIYTPILQFFLNFEIMFLE
jgi:hypothetical protein